MRQGTGESLRAGAPIEGDIKGGETRSFRVSLSDGQFLHVVAEQQAIDLELTLLGPDGRAIVTVDSPNGSDGPEPLFAVASETGDYSIRVHATDGAPPGRFQIRIIELRQAQPVDLSRMSAQRVFAEGRALGRQYNADSLQKAIGRYEEALAVFRSLGDGERQLLTLNNIGDLYLKLGEPRRAVNYFLEALPFCPTARPQTLEAVVLNNIGAAYDGFGEAPKALEYYNRALELRRRKGERAFEAQTLQNIGVVYSNIGEYQNALEHYTEALAIFQSLGERGGEALVLNNIGVAYTQLGDPEGAVDYHRQSLEIRRNLNQPRSEAKTLDDLGVAYARMGDFNKALEYFEAALRIRDTLGDQQGQAATLDNIGQAFAALGHLNRAAMLFDNALTRWQATGDRIGEARTQLNLGLVRLADGKPNEARAHVSDSLALYRRLKNTPGEAAALRGLAGIDAHTGKLNDAFSSIESAIALIETVRTGVGSEELRASYLSRVREYYEFAVDLLIQLHTELPAEGFVVKALQAAERGRARTLLEALHESRASIRRGVDTALKQQEQDLAEQLSAKEAQRARLIRQRRSAGEIVSLEKDAAELMTRYLRVKADLAVNSPHYAGLTQPLPLDLAQIQQQILDQDSVLLEYALGEKRSFLWSVTQTSIDVFALPKRDEVEAGARRLFELLTARNERIKFETTEERRARVQRSEADFNGVASQLARILLGPVAGRLNKKRLIIVTEGALQYVPFGALPADSTGRPLIVDHEIVTLPSLSVVRELRKEIRGRTNALKTIAVLADPVFTKDDPRVVTRLPKATDKQIRSTAEGQRLPTIPMDVTRLPFTRQEADAVASLVPRGQRLMALDFAASKATALGDDLRQYRIIHFATHGLLNSKNPGLSGVVLSLVDHQGRPQDGFLRLNDIYNLELNTDLVVLSGCRTGLGKEIRGEGLIGLTRGFMYAGVPRVIVSLWDVNDAGTAELMKRFYQKLLGPFPLRPPAALRAAQLELLEIKKWSSPYYWAPFVVQGEWK